MEHQNITLNEVWDMIFDSYPGDMENFNSMTKDQAFRLLKEFWKKMEGKNIFMQTTKVEKEEIEKLAKIQQTINEVKDNGKGKVIIFILNGEITGYEKIEGVTF